MTTHDPVRFVAKNMRVDLRLIAEMIAPGTRVLDIGCGDGSLIDHLFRTKGCDARGIEIDMAEVIRAVAHGLPVMHGDADTDLAHYPDGGVRLRGAVAHACRRWSSRATVLRQMLRIGTRAVVSFPEFRPLAVALAVAHQRAHADDADLGPAVARDTEHPSLHDPRLFRSVRRKAMWWNAGLPPMTPAGAGRGGGFRAWPTCSASKDYFCYDVNSCRSPAPSPRRHKWSKAS